MQIIIDAAVDNADDIILTDDIEVDADPLSSLLNCIRRRLTARLDDFQYDEVAAGLESMLGQNINIAKFSIEEAIRRCLSTDFLLSAGDYNVYVLDPTPEGKLPIILKLNFPNADENLATFKVMVNLKNQRAYK